MVSQDLLDILRCPYCVSGETRREGADPGRLQLAGDSAWLVCQESGCNRKYPIREDIPIMLIEEGDKYRATSIEQLGQP
ncbi:MAG TPA: Trm112 family protein [Anaerolineae bacterium]|nr:Trm112 family protein [Anaerolineae bacterium]